MPQKAKVTANPTFVQPPANGATAGQQARHEKRRSSNAKPPSRQLKSKGKTWSPEKPPCKKFDANKNGYLPPCFFDNQVTSVDLTKPNAFGPKLVMQSATVEKDRPFCCCPCVKVPTPMDPAVGTGDAKWSTPVVMTGDFKVKKGCCWPCLYDFQPGMASYGFNSWAFKDAAGHEYLYEYAEKKRCCFTGCCANTCDCCHASQGPLYTVKMDGKLVAQAHGVYSITTFPATMACCFPDKLATISDGQNNELFHIPKPEVEGCCACTKVEQEKSSVSCCVCCGGSSEKPRTRAWYEPWVYLGSSLHASSGPLSGQVAAKVTAHAAEPMWEYGCWDSCCWCCAPNLHHGKGLPNMPLYHTQIEMPTSFDEKATYSPEAWQGLLGWMIMVNMPREFNSWLSIGTSQFTAENAGVPVIRHTDVAALKNYAM
eukprot:m.9242 g.9242  ORF g.9242 m.9242 type:complete len:427 (+) comp4156_c0_seq1:24-1304(+)